MDRIELRSDNAAGTAPDVLAAVDAANHGSAPAYGGDDWSARLDARMSEIFEHPSVRVFPVSSGTAANGLSLSAVCPPWGAVLCSESAHVLTSECGATSMFGGGAVVQAVAGSTHQVGVAGLQAALEGVRWGDPHASQPAVLSLTQATEMGTIYTASEIAALAAAGAERSLRLHVDGARIANAIAALGCAPADVTWRAGASVVSFGAIKNGGMSCDAIVCFDPMVAAELVYRTKRAGHVASKMRFQAVQLLAYLDGGLWLRLAANANARMAELAAGLDRLGIELIARPAVNIAFARVVAADADALADAGLDFYSMSPDVIRLVTSWQTTTEHVERALAAFAAL